MSPANNTNIPVQDFNRHFECIDCSKDIWQHKTTNQKFKVHMELSEYVVGQYID